MRTGFSKYYTPLLPLLAIGVWGGCVYSIVDASRYASVYKEAVRVAERQHGDRKAPFTLDERSEWFASMDVDPSKNDGYPLKKQLLDYIDQSNTFDRK